MWGHCREVVSAEGGSFHVGLGTVRGTGGAAREELAALGSVLESTRSSRYESGRTGSGVSLDDPPQPSARTEGRSALTSHGSRYHMRVS